MSTDRMADNKQIARNTLLLYVRMILLMLVSLYTSRVILTILGVDNFGIYSVVGGIVTIFSVLSGSLTTAISRFITFEIGRGNKDRLKTIFCTSVSIQIVLSVVICAIAEIVGGWFLNSQMNIPECRMAAANWVLQCSILTFVINLISIPYNATIIAHENMSAFAYISILEVLLKLLIVYFLCLFSYDKLIIYVILLVVVACIIRITYGIYCKRHFEEVSYKILWDKSVFKEMLSFAGWNFFGNTAYILNTQGVNMLINVYFGVIVNAARGITAQVEAAVTSFVNNFTMAINPQITKSYASGDTQAMFKLINQGTKFSFYIMYLFVLPIVLEANTILYMWLNNVPSQTAIFLRLALFASLSNVIGNELYYGIISTGKIKKYQIVVSVVCVMVFPMTWIVYKLGFSAVSTYVISFIVYVFVNAIRIIFLKKLIRFPVRRFVIEVLKPILIVSFLSIVVPSLLVYVIKPSFVRLLMITIIGSISTLAIIYLFGLSVNERCFLLSKIKDYNKKWNYSKKSRNS